MPVRWRPASALRTTSRSERASTAGERTLETACRMRIAAPAGRPARGRGRSREGWPARVDGRTGPAAALRWPDLLHAPTVHRKSRIAGAPFPAHHDFGAGRDDRVTVRASSRLRATAAPRIVFAARWQNPNASARLLVDVEPRHPRPSCSPRWPRARCARSRRRLSERRRAFGHAAR